MTEESTSVNATEGGSVSTGSPATGVTKTVLSRECITGDKCDEARSISSAAFNA